MRPTPITQILNANTNISNLDLEDTLRIDLSELDKPEGKEEINNCATYLRKGANAFGDTFTDWILLTFFDQLYGYAKGITVPAPPSTQGYVTGLKMIYGIDTARNNTFQLIYQPVKMARSGAIVNGQAEYDVYNYLDNGLEAFFVYDNVNDTLNQINVATKNSLANDYKNIIQFIRYGNTNFVPGQDVESVIFSFQEIFCLIFDNEGYSPDAEFTRIDMHTAIRIENDNTIKQSVLLAPELPIIFQDFKGKYANRSHMCPPSCNKIVYFVN